MNSPLGEFKKIDVRDMWKHESADFTPWLAQDENIVTLGEALGIELEVERVEAAVGPYSADILAKDTGTDTYVVIENQLGKTDHDHLGKAITYGSVLHASAVVWIATHFTEEHRRAIDWLNEFTTEDLSFYGVHLELWQIDDSLPAVRFDVTSRPAAIKKDAARGETRELTETQQLQLGFWTAFRDALIEANVMASAQTPKPQNVFDVSLGRSGMHICCTANVAPGKIGLRVYLYNTIAEKALPQLEAQREEIEREIGLALEWNPNKDARDKTIGIHRDADLRDRSCWDEYVGWLVDMTGKFRKAFMPRAKKLSL